MLWLRSVTAIEVISIVFLFHSNQWRTWCTVVPKDEPVHDLLRVDKTITDGSAGVFYIPVMLVRVSNHDVGRVLMESCSSLDGWVDQGIKNQIYIACPYWCSTDEKYGRIWDGTCSLTPSIYNTKIDALVSFESDINVI